MSAFHLTSAPPPCHIYNEAETRVDDEIFQDQADVTVDSSLEANPAGR